MAADPEQLMTPEELAEIGVSSMSDSQKQALSKWGLRMFGLGQHIVADIEAVKYGGRLIVLDDGSRWEVEPGDAEIAHLWKEMDKVVIIDGAMFRLHERDRVDVEEEFL